MNIGDVYHGLKILACCGRGAYGEVYYCEDISGKRMAVKIVPKSILGKEWERELRGVINYRRITETAADLLQIFHVEEDAESFFYTMEAADSMGQDGYRPDTLANRLEAGPLDEKELWNTLWGVFSGIKAIHDAGFAHRDVKPDNILFVSGVPKLGDIGLVSSLSATMSQLAGTLDFLPPEVRTAEYSEHDSRTRQRSDLYAFGKVIYCAVTGEAPSIWPTLPKEFKLTLAAKLFLRLALRLCAKDPVQRLRDVRQIEKELQDIRRKLTTGETAIDHIRYWRMQIGSALRGGWYGTLRWCKRHYLILAGVVLAFAGIVWYMRPIPVFDPAKEESKHFEDAHTGVSMEIPKQWEIITPEMMLQNVDRPTPPAQTPLEKLSAKQLAAFRQLGQMGVTMIVCDIAPDFVDIIVVYQNENTPGGDLLALPDDQLRLYTRAVLMSDLEMKVTFYDWQRREIAGFPVIYIDSSAQPEKIRANNYVFVLEDRLVSIVSTARNKTYQELKAQMEAVLKTVKINGKPAVSVRKPEPAVVSK